MCSWGGLGSAYDIIALDWWMQLSEDLKANINEITVSLGK